ncbi:hypothetical protein HMPREF9954_0039 [Streptococcus infantis SK970]|nr:hypothetical protein HMPREF9954_0039 [Streptococcus infantis SK970]
MFSSFFLTPFLDVIYLTSKETTKDLCIYGNTVQERKSS